MSTQPPFTRDRKTGSNSPPNTRRGAPQHAHDLFLRYFNYFWVRHLTNPIFWLIFIATMLSLGLPILPSANPIIQHGGLIDRLCTMSLITIRLCMVAYLLLLGTVLVVLIGCIAGYTSLLGVISLSIGLAHSFAAMLEDFERDYANVKHRLASTTRRLVFVLRLLLYYLAFVTTFNIMFGTAYGALQWNNDRLKGLNGDYDSLAFNIGRGIAIYANEWAVIHVYIAKKAVEGISYTFKEVVEGSQKGWKFSVWI